MFAENQTENLAGRVPSKFFPSKIQIPKIGYPNMHPKINTLRKQRIKTLT